MIITFLKNLAEILLWIISTLNPIYHIAKQFSITANMNEILLQLIANGGTGGIIAIFAFIGKRKKTRER